MAFYNENDLHAAQWLRNLASANLIQPGPVDECSIAEVEPEDLVGHQRVHLFAGIGTWDRAIEDAGWGNREVWSASCPCQSFSSAGRGRGFDDPRHLWPQAFRLIDARRPQAVLGEQVASPAGLAWLDIVFADLEGAGYTCWAIDIAAAGVGAPHLRQRLYWCALALGNSSEPRSRRNPGAVPSQEGASAGRGISPGNLADIPESASTVDRLADRSEGGREVVSPPRVHAPGQPGYDTARRSAIDSTPWRDPDWVWCRDSRWRPVEPEPLPVVDGTPARVGSALPPALPTSPLIQSDQMSGRSRPAMLRAYGNAIVLPLATEFASLVLEALEMYGQTIP